MPRPNRPRTMRSEASLARRIEYERQRRGWSLEGLSKRLTDAGCAIQASAIYKIEKGDPPRRIAVDELVALAAVFDVDVASLLLPPETVADQETVRLWEAYVAAHAAGMAADERRDAAWHALGQHMKSSPEARGSVERMLSDMPDWGPRLLEALEDAGASRG
jgi:transcriptional regulator with XRE-family HTH domain